METTFRPQVESAPTPAPESAPMRETANVVEGVEDRAISRDADSLVDESLEVWETENNRKYGVDYFNIRETAHEFPVKAHFGAIDKYVKSEIAERGWKSDKASYSKILGEIESEIGTENLSQYKKLQKIFNYLQTFTSSIFSCRRHSAK